jgi:hypothetical protein
MDHVVAVVGARHERNALAAIRCIIEADKANLRDAAPERPPR